MHTAPTPCPGRCNHAWRRAEQDRENLGALHELSPRWGDPLWCDRCTQQFREDVADFPRLAVEIFQQALSGTATPSLKTSKTRPAVYTWPGQQSRLLADEIRDALTSLEDDVRQLCGLTPRQLAGREGPTIASAARFIDAHTEWIVTHHPIADDPEDAPPAYLMRLHARAVRFVGDGKPRPDHKFTPCPGCGWATLFQQEGGDYIECTTCGRLLTANEYRDHTREAVIETERLLVS
jgi:hypothetical protein